MLISLYFPISTQLFACKKEFHLYVILTKLNYEHFIKMQFTNLIIYEYLTRLVLILSIYDL